MSRSENLFALSGIVLPLLHASAFCCQHAGHIGCCLVWDLGLEAKRPEYSRLGQFIGKSGRVGWRAVQILRNEVPSCSKECDGSNHTYARKTVDGM
jgi:hypothetical protein